MNQLKDFLAETKGDLFRSPFEHLHHTYLAVAGAAASAAGFCSAAGASAAG